QGIGRAVSFAFAREGAHVVVADIDVEAGEECVAEVKAQGGAATFLATDVGDEASVKNLMGEVERRFGRLHYLCNNAGISYNAPLEELDRKSTRLNSSHVKISYAVFCLKKKTRHTASRLWASSSRPLC